MTDIGRPGLLDLEKELSCSICTEILYQPLTLLDCLHTFCGSCLKLWFAWQALQAQSRRTNPYTCPSCRATVRGTRPDAKITTLLDMYLQANPTKAKSEEEKEDIKKKYTPGENVIPKPSPRGGHSSDETRMIDEVRAMSLRDNEVRSAGSYERGTNHSSSNRERRTERASARSSSEAISPQRHVEHQSSLRSMISSSDADSSEMVDEILRQITEDGLLDGIDLQDMTVTQLDELSERIAEAYRQRHPQPIRSEARRAHHRNEAEVPTTRRPHSTGRQHSRSAGAADQPPASAHPSHSRPHLLEVDPAAAQSRRRTSSESRREGHSNRNLSPGSPNIPELAARSASDLADRPHSSRRRDRRPSEQGRRSTEPSPGSRSMRSEQRHGSGPSSRSRNSPARSPRHDDSAGLIPVNSPIETMIPDNPLQTQSGGGGDPHQPSPNNDDHTSPATSPRSRPCLFPEPTISCHHCGRSNLQYEVHEFCAICKDGQFSLCHRCYRSGRGCLHWFGFGKAAWPRFRQKSQSEIDLPHSLTGRQYRRPRPETVQSVQAAVDSERRILTTEDPTNRMQVGVFCSICKAYADERFWKCEACNDGEWGFCNNCVNQGNCCTHPLLPLANVNAPASDSTQRPSTSHSTSEFAPITSPTMIQSVPSSSLANSRQYRPLIFTVNCQICRYPIEPSSSRFHCFSCNGGDYDVCVTCYANLVDSGRISPENGDKGWRRCLQSHRMIVLAFDDTPMGQRRLVTHDIVGGLFLKDEASGTHAEDTQEFSWIEGGERKTRTVKRDLSPRPGIGGDNIAAAPILQKFPPDGGVGLRLYARWAWLPDEGVTDELSFPRGAEIREALEISSEWYMGAYAGAKGVFPSNYVMTLGAVTM